MNILKKSKDLGERRSGGGATRRSGGRGGLGGNVLYEKRRKIKRKSATERLRVEYKFSV